ncbi:MAG: DUF2283 domain-containing protein [Candidatus Methylomirabilis oxygeniifera]|nr:MAG: DUF2283 domain-containing protein [Candidatus Methylomirabilis oxyfera]MBE7458550.1 DUF2283 domain-containing protein [Planctomycetia bacterium]
MGQRNLALHMTYDKEADAAYVYLSQIRAGEVAKTVDMLSDVFFDLDANGRILGIEILGASQIIPSNVIDPDGCRTA